MTVACDKGTNRNVDYNTYTHFLLLLDDLTCIESRFVQIFNDLCTENHTEYLADQNKIFELPFIWLQCDNFSRMSQKNKSDMSSQCDAQKINTIEDLGIFFA